MKVGYNVMWAGLFLVLGGIEIAAGVVTEVEVQLALGIAFVGFGALWMLRPYFEFDPATRTLAVKALIGSRARRFGGSEGGWLDIEADRIIWVRPGGTRKTVPVRRYQANRDEWNAVLVQIVTGAAPRG